MVDHTGLWQTLRILLDLNGSARLVLTCITGLYTDESPGLKVDPVVVLVLSLVFIFSVVALHSKSPAIFCDTEPSNMTRSHCKDHTQILQLGAATLDWCKERKQRGYSMDALTVGHGVLRAGWFLSTMYYIDSRADKIQRSFSTLYAVVGCASASQFGVFWTP